MEHVGGPDLLGLSFLQYMALFLGVALLGIAVSGWFRRKK